MATATKKLVYGAGINDADYKIRIRKTVGHKPDGTSIRQEIWVCPFYLKWKEMIRRCYSQESLKRNPTYLGCSVVNEWLRFSNFKEWMLKQDWENKQLDKDILFPGNKQYGPNSCVFVEGRVNRFVLDSGLARGNYPVGVDFCKVANKFRAYCKDITTNKQRYLGLFLTAKEAHQAWLAFKLSQAHILAAEQTDPRVAAALIDRYENYSKYFDQGT